MKIKQLVIGIVAVAVLLVILLPYGTYSTGRLYADNMESLHNGYLFDNVNWEITIKKFMTGQRSSPVVSVSNEHLSNILVNPNFTDHVSDIGGDSFVPFIEYVMQFGNITIANSPEDRRIAYLMVLYDLLADVDTLWDLEIQYARREITAEEYIEAINSCPCISMSSFGIEIVEIEVAEDGSIVGLDPVEWMKEKGWERWAYDCGISNQHN